MSRWKSYIPTIPAFTEGLDETVSDWKSRGLDILWQHCNGKARIGGTLAIGQYMHITAWRGHLCVGEGAILAQTEDDCIRIGKRLEIEPKFSA
jgi:hypothetical protein